LSSRFLLAFLFSALFHGVLDVTRDLMRRAFGLVEFAFALQFFISDDFASRVFNSAFRLFSDAFDVFASDLSNGRRIQS
jgi:hypothetical protein